MDKEWEPGDRNNTERTIDLGVLEPEQIVKVEINGFMVRLYTERIIYFLSTADANGVMLDLLHGKKVSFDATLPKGFTNPGVTVRPEYSKWLDKKEKEDGKKDKEQG